MLLFPQKKFKADEDKPKRWWHKLPGLIRSLAASITAPAELMAAVKQTGWFDQVAVQAAVTTDVPSNALPAGSWQTGEVV